MPDAAGGGSARCGFADKTAAGFGEDELRAIEVAAVEAWPAFETRNISGWLWRYSGGGSQRANSVSTLEFRGPDAEAAIAEAEALYFSRNVPSRFQVSSTLAEPMMMLRAFSGVCNQRTFQNDGSSSGLSIAIACEPKTSKPNPFLEPRTCIRKINNVLPLRMPCPGQYQRFRDSGKKDAGFLFLFPQ